MDSNLHVVCLSYLVHGHLNYGKSRYSSNLAKLLRTLVGTLGDTRLSTSLLRFCDLHQQYRMGLCRYRLLGWLDQHELALLLP